MENSTTQLCERRSKTLATFSADPLVASEESIKAATGDELVLSRCTMEIKVRKAHLNDLENIVPFVLLGFLYVTTDPKPSIALWHYRIFLASRILHTFIYVKGIRQPFRAIAFATGFSTLASMAAQTIMATYKYF